MVESVRRATFKNVVILKDGPGDIIVEEHKGVKGRPDYSKVLLRSGKTKEVQELCDYPEIVNSYRDHYIVTQDCEGVTYNTELTPNIELLKNENKAKGSTDKFEPDVKVPADFYIHTNTKDDQPKIRVEFYQQEGSDYHTMSISGTAEKDHILRQANPIVERAIDRALKAEGYKSFSDFVQAGGFDKNSQANTFVNLFTPPGINPPNIFNSNVNSGGYYKVYPYFLSAKFTLDNSSGPTLSKVVIAYDLIPDSCETQVIENKRKK
jgi:hypothetical protein